MIKAAVMCQGKVQAVFSGDPSNGEAEQACDELNHNGFPASVIFIPMFETAQDFLTTRDVLTED